MSNLEVLELTAKSIRSWNFRPFLTKFTGEYLYGPVLSKNIEKLFSKVIFLIFKVEICRLWQKTLIFDNFFFEWLRTGQVQIWWNSPYKQTFYFLPFNYQEYLIDFGRMKDWVDLREPHSGFERGSTPGLGIQCLNH